MKLDPRKECEISEKLAYENFECAMMNMFHFWTGRAGGIGWCINHLNDKATLLKEYEACLQAQEECRNAPNFVRYYEGRADGVRWCVENFDNLELLEDISRKEE